MHIDDIHPTDEIRYRHEQRRIRGMRNHLANHSHGCDPDCPEYTDEDIDELERELEGQWT